jgi:hypothetical protein
MRSSLITFIAVAAALLVAPSFASADDVGGGDDLQEVLSRMSDLEQQLKATNDALAASSAKVDQQQKMLSKFETSEQSGPMLALSNFLSETTFEGWVSTSYFYNFNNPDSGRNIGANAGTIGANPYHQNHNSFQVDQVWFSMSNEATAESRGGFEIDIVYGETGDQLAIGVEGNAIFDYLFNANVSYLAPISDAGIKITAGRFEKHIGSEAAQGPHNFNITRGVLYTLQPVNFTGVKLSSKYDSGFDWMIGVSNNSGYATLDTNPYALAPNAQNYDTDEEKVLLWRVGYQATDTLAFAFNGLYGGNCATGSPTLGVYGGACGAVTRNGIVDASNSDRQVLFDWTINWDPSDRLSTWLNASYMYTDEEERVGDPDIFGVAVAGRYGITDATGIALRLEYIKSKDSYLELAAPPLNPSTFINDGPPAAIANAGDEQEIWTVTATVDHQLTDHLSVKAEVVYQEGNSEDNTDNQYFCNDSCNANELDRRQVLVGAQMTYEF